MKDEAVTELDLTQQLAPPFHDSDGFPHRLLVTRTPAVPALAQVADLLSCLAALPVETRVAVLRPPLKWTSNGEAGDGQDICSLCSEEADEPHSIARCRANLEAANGAGWHAAGLAEERASQAESALTAAKARIAALEAESAWRAIEWDNPETYPANPQLVLIVLHRAGSSPFVSQAGWYADEEKWIDIETDGQNDHIEWAPGEVTHWRPMPKPPEER